MINKIYQMIAAHRSGLANFFAQIEAAEQMQASRLSLTPPATRNEIVVVTLQDGRDGTTTPQIITGLPAMPQAFA